MKNKYLIIFGVIGVIIIVALVFMNPGQEKKTSVNLDVFAKCLAEKNITMYGAEWCPHCQNQKKAFGDSFRFVPYVECPADPKRCLAEGINGYPTWVFPASSAGGFNDGKKFEGEQALEKLSQESGCVLPDSRRND